MPTKWTLTCDYLSLTHLGSQLLHGLGNFWKAAVHVLGCILRPMLVIEGWICDWLCRETEFREDGQTATGKMRILSAGVRALVPPNLSYERVVWYNWRIKCDNFIELNTNRTKQYKKLGGVEVIAPDMWRPANNNMKVADALAPNKCQIISNNQVKYNNSFAWIILCDSRYHVTVMKKWIIRRENMPSAKLPLLSVIIRRSHLNFSDNPLWHSQRHKLIALGSL